LALALAALTLAGCGKASSANPVEARLQREDFVAVARVLQGVEPAVDSEVAAARAAWPFILDGLPAQIGARARARILAAVESALRMPLPALMAERQAAALTGPGSPLAGRYRDFWGLCRDSWKQLAAALGEIEHGSPRAARFARATAALYVEGIYDAHYSIAEAGEQVSAAYQTLGGAPVLGAVMSERAVGQLAASFTRPRDELSPHERVKLGS
jgi:hypothetical protein